MSSDSDDAEQPTEDCRIAKLYSAADKATPHEFVSLLDEVGTRSAIVYGGMMMDAAVARAHFVVMALLDADDGSLTACIEARKELLRAVVAAGGAGAGVALVACIEAWVCSEVEEGPARETAISSFDEVLRALFEWDVVGEDDLRAWQADERAARLLQVPKTSAIRMHERGLRFINWLDRGEAE